MLAVVKWWARVRGFLTEPGKDWTNHPEWVVHPMSAHVSIGRFAAVDADGVESGGGGWRVSFAVALAWALLVESGAESVDVGRCPKCGGTTWERMPAVKGDWMQALRNALENGWERDPDDPTFDRHIGHRCPACTGTGRERTPVAVLLLDAVESVDAREYLAAHADQLLAAGNPLGELIAWAVRLWMKPLRVSDCDGVTPDSIDLSFAHTAEAVRWLEWLTWGNWFAEHYLRNYTFNAEPVTRVYTDSLPLLVEPTFGGAGEVISVTAGEHTYSVTTERPMTASEIAAAFNEQGGPVTWSSYEDGSGLMAHFDEPGSVGASVSMIEPPAFIPEPESPRHQPHARHIGDRLGRRLGVRR
jgi:hypothetical protein